MSADSDLHTAQATTLRPSSRRPPMSSPGHDKGGRGDVLIPTSISDEKMELEREKAAVGDEY